MSELGGPEAPTETEGVDERSEGRDTGEENKSDRFHSFEPGTEDSDDSGSAREAAHESEDGSRHQHEQSERRPEPQEADEKADEKAETDAQRQEEIKNILKECPTGREAMKVEEDYQVTVKSGPEGQGSYYNPATNEVFIDSRESSESAALTYVHEMNHAKYANEGRTANEHSLSRDAYVKNMVEEEAEGTVKSIEAKMELEGTRADVSSTSFPLETEYRQAYQNAVDTAKAQNPEITEDQLKDVGRQAGKERVTEGFMNGEVVTSNTGESYPDYYGEYWDKVNKKWSE
jgi:hypothetical protein